MPATFEFTLAAKRTTAFVSRTVGPEQSSTDLRKPVDAPIGLLADKLYPGEPAGQAAAAPPDARGEWWGTVEMRR